MRAGVHFLRAAVAGLAALLWPVWVHAGATSPEDLPLRPSHDPPAPGW